VHSSSNPLYRVLLVIAAGIGAVSFAAVFIRWCDAPPLAIACYRLLFASILFWITGGARYWPEFRKFSRADWIWGFISGFALAMHFATWITSLSYTSVASSVVLVAISPIFVALGAVAVLREPVHPLLYGGLLLAVAGATIITFDEAAGGKNSLFGNALAVAGAFFGGIYFLIGRVMRRRMATVPYVTLCYSAAAIFLWLATQIFAVPLHGYSLHTFGLFLLLAVIPQMIGHTSFNWALKYLSAPTVTVTLLGEPVGASILAFLFFNEQPPMRTILGGGVVLAGVAAAIFSEGRKA
jgi:drug/metabolite transporter (DMT)-like permease